MPSDPPCSVIQVHRSWNPQPCTPGASRGLHVSARHWQSFGHALAFGHVPPRSQASLTASRNPSPHLDFSATTDRLSPFARSVPRSFPQPPDVVPANRTRPVRPGQLAHVAFTTVLLRVARTC